MAGTTTTYVNHTVKSGDTLWSLAEKYYGSGERWKELAEQNNLKPTYRAMTGSGQAIEMVNIYPGQGISIKDPVSSGSGTGSPGGSSGSGGSGSSNTPKNLTSTPKIEYFSLQAGTDTTVFAAWSWDKENTENYEVSWYYDTGDKIWFEGNSSTVDIKQSIYSAPSNAKRVKFKVKPLSKKHEVNKKEVEYWTANWSTTVTYSFSENPPTTPDTPTVEIKDYTLTAKLENLDVNGTEIQFQIVRDNNKVYKTAKVAITTNHAGYSCTIIAGSEYKVRCRAFRDELHSEWSPYSDNASTKPAAPSRITVCKAMSETSVYLEWAAGNSATTYDIEYANKKEYLDGSNATTTESGIETTKYTLTGLESGLEYFFRVRSVNDQGTSAWTSIRSIVIGKKPAAPTTWSSTTTAITGEPLTLRWTHNSEDESAQSKAEIELYIDGVKETHTIDSSEEEDDEKTMFYSIDTSQYVEGTKIQWRVRTAGITKVYGDWSIQRTVDIYAPPTLALSVTNVEGENVEYLTSFPINVTGETGPNTQSPVAYHLIIVANSAYETVDDIGNRKLIAAGQEVFSRYINTNEQLSVVLSAGDVNLENNIQYTIRCTAAMDSGLTAEATHDFGVDWSDIYYEPNAEIFINQDDLTASIRPYCEDEYGVPIEGVTLSVYRREYDGSFTEIITGVDNTSYTFVTDPHPALDFARYRIVAITESTGAVSYFDLPGYPVGEKAVIIQWDDEWSNFNGTNEDELEQPLWAGSMLKLPYNIDVADQHEVDVELVEYIGRKHPVTYYGTQLGISSSWKMDIDKEDIDTLYALRRLAIWAGDVYVREPSGSGYWANISVSFSQEHLKLTIPVTLSIKRVAGGM